MRRGRGRINRSKRNLRSGLDSSTTSLTRTVRHAAHTQTVCVPSLPLQYSFASQSSTTEADNEPWYVKSAGKREAEKEETTSGVGSGLGVGSGAGSGSVSAEVKRKSAKAEHRKELQDPLLSMKHYVTAKKKKEGLVVEGGVAACQRQTHSTGSRVSSLCLALH